MDDAEKIITHGWRQGAVLLPESASSPGVFEPLFKEIAAESILIVITQDCDVVQTDFEKEPHVEVLLARPITGTPNGNCLYGKNPRLIQFRVGERYFEVSCHDRARTDRRILANCRPCEVHSLDEDSILMLRQWLAKRYTRPAFPDQLNRRIKSKPHGPAISRILEQSGHLFQQIFLSCTPRYEELAPADSYRLIVWPTMTVDDHNDGDLRNQAIQAATDLEAALTKCPGIEVKKCEVRHQGQITLDDLNFFSEWDFDFLTHRGILAN